MIYERDSLHVSLESSLECHIGDDHLKGEDGKINEVRIFTST